MKNTVKNQNAKRILNAKNLSPVKPCLVHAEDFGGSFDRGLEEAYMRLILSRKNARKH